MIFKIDNVKKSYKNGEVTEEILKGVNLFLREGEVTALVGASGSGKSTLLTIAAGLQPASDGQIIFEGKNLTSMNSEQVRKSEQANLASSFNLLTWCLFLQ